MSELDQDATYGNEQVADLYQSRFQQAAESSL